MLLRSFFFSAKLYQYLLRKSENVLSLLYVLIYILKVMNQNNPVKSIMPTQREYVRVLNAPYQ